MARHFVYTEVQEPLTEADVAASAQITLTRADGSIVNLTGRVVFVAHTEAAPTTVPSHAHDFAADVTGTISGTTQPAP